MATNNFLLCCDWGTSSFRLRLINVSDNSVMAEHQSSEGVAATFRSWEAGGSQERFEFYASRLRSALKHLSESSQVNLSDIPIIVSGMASSSIGMEEIPYASLPFALNGSGVASKVYRDFNGSGTPLILVSGVKSDVDVMRGEEAQLMGLCNLDKSLCSDNKETTFVFPGTHSKHMQVSGGQIIDFKTYMTGELFNIISAHSILKDSTAAGGNLSDPDNRLAFSSGIETSGSSTLLHNLFTVRTNQLFSKFTKEQNSFYLSGLLIGDELRQLLNEPGRHLVICSGLNLFEHYKLGAGVLNLRENITFIPPERIDKATIAGQVQIFNAITTKYE